MAQRSIDQEQFGFGGRERAASSLDALASLVDWSPVSAVLDPLYPATKGEPAWPPLAMFKAVLLSIWYDLSDVRLAEVLDDRPSFRCFCGISANEATPERTAFVRFRRLLVAPLNRSFQTHWNVVRICHSFTSQCFRSIALPSWLRNNSSLPGAGSSGGAGKPYRPGQTTEAQPDSREKPLSSPAGAIASSSPDRPNALQIRFLEIYQNSGAPAGLSII